MVDQRLRPGTARYGQVARPSDGSWNSAATVASISGVTRMSLSDITIRSCRAAASMRSRLKTLAFGYGGSPVTMSRDGICG